MITGPESTGKTLISAYLSEKLHCPWLPEYAREYVSKLQRKYNFDDLVHIADAQIRQKELAESHDPSFLILDTWLVITKIWFLEVFGECPKFVDDNISKHRIDLALVCNTDIPWIPDPLRENGGERREYLLNRYLDEIRVAGWDFMIISGTGQERYANALKAVSNRFNLTL